MKTVCIFGCGEHETIEVNGLKIIGCPKVPGWHGGYLVDMATLIGPKMRAFLQEQLDGQRTDHSD